MKTGSESSGSVVWFPKKQPQIVPRPRIMLYSPGMIGLGHIRRNLSIARSLTESDMKPIILLIAENREASAFAMPQGVDCVTLPALRKELDGNAFPRYLDIGFQELIKIRSGIIQTAVKEFQPDIFIVDHLARGAFNELDPTLKRLRRNDNTICVLGIRDIIGDPEKVRSEWRKFSTLEWIQKFYDIVFVYGDPRICDVADVYGLALSGSRKLCYTGYLDRSTRLARAIEENHDPYPGLRLPPGKLCLCLVGGGQDGARLAETFGRARLPANTNGIVVTGPYMAEASLTRLKKLASSKDRLRILQFVEEPILLVNRADLVIAMGGYNTVCEILSFGKASLIVPRVKKAPEQALRAMALRSDGLRLAASWCAWRESAACVAAPRPSRLSALRIALERFGLTLCGWRRWPAR